MHKLIAIACSLILFWSGTAVAHAQLIINGTTLFDDMGNPTGETAEAIEGGNVSVINDFPVSITVRVYNEENRLVAEGGILADDRYHGPHGLPAGSYTVTISTPQPVGGNGTINFVVTSTLVAAASPPARNASGPSRRPYGIRAPDGHCPLGTISLRRTA